MTSKAVIGMAFAAGCALALGVVPPATAQTGVNTQVLTNGPQASMARTLIQELTAPSTSTPTSTATP